MLDQRFKILIFNNYIRKPFLAETLLNRITSLLNSALVPENSVVDETEAAKLPLQYYQATLSLDPAENLPPYLASLLPLGFGSGVQITQPASLVIPFQFSGSLDAATETFEQHLKQNQIAVEKCKIVPQ